MRDPFNYAPPYLGKVIEGEGVTELTETLVPTVQHTTNYRLAIKNGQYVLQVATIHSLQKKDGTNVLNAIQWVDQPTINYDDTSVNPPNTIY